MSKSILKDKSFNFAVKIVNLARNTMDDKREYILSKQICKSGTAIGALIREAQNAESKADFIHKLAIAQKEADETLYWLDLMHVTIFLDSKIHIEMSNECTELLKMVRSSILTTKNNNTKK
jgi:four helix bundle protein